MILREAGGQCPLSNVNQHLSPWSRVGDLTKLSGAGDQAVVLAPPVTIGSIVWPKSEISQNLDPSFHLT